MAIDPRILAAMEQYSQGGPNPFFDDYDLNAYPYVMPPEDEDELGTLDYQNDTFTAQRKAQQLMMDPSYILSLGTSAGGYGPEAFDTVPVLQPINANGRVMLRRWQSGADGALEQSIAEMMALNQGPGEIEAAIARLLAEGGPDAEALQAAIPPAYSNGMVLNGQPDLGYVRDRIAALTGALESDDPMADEWDGITMDPETGSPAILTQVPSDASMALQRGGFSHNPYETYDPDLFAEGGPDEGARQRAMMQQYLDNMGTAANESSKIDTFMGKMGRTQDQLLAAGGNIGGLAAGNVRPSSGSLNDYVSEYMGRMSPPAAPATTPGITNMLPTSAMGVAYGAGQSVPRQAGQRTDDIVELLRNATREFQSKTGRGGVQPNEQASMLRRQLDLERQALGDVRRSFRGSAGSFQDRGLQRQSGEMANTRQRYVEDLAAQGFTPFNAQMQARMRNLWQV